MTNEELEALCKEHAPEQKPYAQVVERVISALRNHDPTLAEQILSSSALLVPKRSMVLEILAPVLRAVGEEWQRGRITVWQEHLLSTLIRNTAGALPQAAQNGDAMLFATPPFELHEFGITLAAILASAHGWRTANLGTGVPAKEIVHAVRRLKPKIVVVGMTMHSIPKASAMEYAQALERDLPVRLDVWLGGTLGAHIAKRTGSSRVHAVATLEEFDRRCRSAVTARV
jgi:methanogenic corrinoid protein MtbC1